MTMSHSDTQRLFNEVLSWPREQARDFLGLQLRAMGRTEPEFCAGVMEHGPSFKHDANQWFDFFSKIPNKLFRDERVLMSKLSESQRDRLKFLF